MVVAVYDTVREVTAITVFVDTEGDTLRVERITDRDDAKLRVISSEIVVKNSEVETVSDTLIVSDTIAVNQEPTADPSLQAARNGTWLSTLKWVFGIILALAVLVFMVKNNSK